jgi:hypothetical protein
MDDAVCHWHLASAEVRVDVPSAGDVLIVPVRQTDLKPGTIRPASALVDLPR